MPFKPGQSGNPKGKPKGAKSIPDFLRRSGGWKCPDGFLENLKKHFGDDLIDSLTIDQATLMQVRLDALKGNSWAVGFIADRTEGKVANEHKIGGLDTVGPLDIVIK